MPLFFFDLQAPGVARDAAGLDLADEAAARLEAVKRAGAYLIDNPAVVLKQNEITVQVRRADRRTVFVVHCLAMPTASAA